MKKLFLLSAMCFVALLIHAQDVDKEIEAIKRVIQTSYVEGIQNEGDMAKIDAGIHPDFKLLGIDKDNGLWQLPISEWKEKIKKRKESGHYPRTGENKISIKFLNVDVTGTAAVAKFEFYVGKQLKYVDFISLYKFTEGWKLVSKIYYKFPEN